MKKNKLGIIIFGIILVAILIVVGFFVIKDAKSGKVEEVKIASTITLDINPSIEINLDKDEKVINVIALNDDAKDLVNDEYTGKSLDNVITNITETLIEKGYAKEKIVILLNTKGNISSSTIQNIITSTLETKKIDSEIIVQNTSANASANAKKYNISESKASLIEEIVKANDSKTFEDLKDKSISELAKLKNESKEESTKEIESRKGDENGPVYEEPSYNYSCTPPSDLKSSEWCSWNINRPPYCEYYYPERINDDIYDRALNYLGLSNFDSIGGYATEQADSRSSYCIADIAIITTRETRTNLVFDSVTGELIEKSSTPVPMPIFSEEEAIQKGLAYFGLDESKCRYCQVSYGTDREGSDEWYYRYQVLLDMIDGNCHTIDYNTQTGEIVSTREWRNN